MDAEEFAGFEQVLRERVVVVARRRVARGMVMSKEQCDGTMANREREEVGDPHVDRIGHALRDDLGRDHFVADVAGHGDESFGLAAGKERVHGA